MVCLTIVKQDIVWKKLSLKAIAKLCEGMTAEDIAAKLLGNTCGGKPTSCADQLAKAVLGREP